MSKTINIPSCDHTVKPKHALPDGGAPIHGDKNKNGTALDGEPHENDPRPKHPTAVKKLSNSKQTTVDRAEFKQLDKKVRDSAAAFMECGKALLEIRSRKLWKAGGHDTWQSYCREVAGMSPPHAHRIIEGSQIALELAESLPVGNDSPPMHPVSESQVRPLAKIKDLETRKTIWQHSVEDAGGQPTAKTVAAKVAEYMAENAERPVRPADSGTKNETDQVEAIEVETEVIETQDETLEEQAEAIEVHAEPIEVQIDNSVSPPRDGGDANENPHLNKNGIPFGKWTIDIGNIIQEALKMEKTTDEKASVEKILVLAREMRDDFLSFQKRR
jgi:hypothetical protein